MGTDESPELKSPLEGKPGNSAKPKPTDTMSTLNYSWNVRGTLNGNFVGASGTTASVDGVAEVHGTAGEGAPFDHSSWIWAGMAHYGLGWMKGGHKVNPCEKYPFHMTRHWYGEDGNKEKGTWVVKAWPQYAVAVPKGNDHVWYRATFQLELNDGTFYSGYWEMDIHFRK